MKQSNFAWDHFELVLGQVKHRDAGLRKRRGRPSDKLVVAEVQRSDRGHIAECMWQRTEEVVARVQLPHAPHFQNKLRYKCVVV